MIKLHQLADYSQLVKILSEFLITNTSEVLENTFLLCQYTCFTLLHVMSLQTTSDHFLDQRGKAKRK